jgi:hypothetical protein
VREFERELRVKYNYDLFYKVWQALKNHAIKKHAAREINEQAVSQIQAMIKRRFLHKMIEAYNY